MGKQRGKMPGLRWRNGVWNIEKRCRNAPGGWLRESTGKTDRAEAEEYLIGRLADLAERRQRIAEGRHTFEDAGLRYLEDIAHKASADDAAFHLDRLFQFVGELDLEAVHDGTLAEFINHERGRGLAPKSINNALAVVSAVLNRAARVWRDEHGRPWLRQAPPKLTRLPVTGKQSKPYPLSWTEQDRLVAALPGHLQAMALYAVNTGCREQEVCQLRWEWLHQVDGLTVVVIPAGFAKNRDERVVALNSVAQRVIGAQRGRHAEMVFTYTRGTKHPKVLPVGTMNSSAWRRAWQAAELPVEGWTHGPHNLRHTFGRRLRAAGVPLETRKALLGHRNGDLTTHYSAAEIQELLTAAERVTRRSTEAPTLRVVGSMSDKCRMDKKKAGSA